LPETDDMDLTIAVNFRYNGANLCRADIEPDYAIPGHTS
jgi:hypothetical protein